MSTIKDGGCYIQKTLQESAGIETSEEKISESELKHLYHAEEKTVHEIKSEFRISSRKIFDLFEKYDIETRTPQETYELKNDTRYRNEEFLKEHYVHKEKSMKEIGEMCNKSGSTISDWLDRHNIEKRQNSDVGFRLAGYNCEQMNYPMVTKLGSSKYLQVHQLVSIANGADPEKVFSPDYDVHHKNGHKCDNRPDNLELMKKELHGRKHAHEGWQSYDDDDIQFVIEYMMNLASYCSDD